MKRQSFQRDVSLFALCISLSKREPIAHELAADTDDLGGIGAEVLPSARGPLASPLVVTLHRSLGRCQKRVETLLNDGVAFA